jgi:formylmethanofuran dehydrogenase subunit B
MEYLQRLATVPVALPSSDTVCKTLREARAPGILGLHLVTVETVEAAVSLAQSLDAWLSPWPADPIRFWGHQAPDLGMSRAEVEQAADLVLFIGFPNGVDTVQPRFRERHLQRGLGLARRQIDVNWPEATRLQQVIELRRALRPPPEHGVITRSAARQEPRPPTSGLQYDNLATAIRDAKCVQIYVLAQLASEAPEYITHWQHLAAEQRAHRRMGLTLLGATGKARTVTEALTWRTGYPGPLRFHQGTPEYLPHVGEVESLLNRNALDTIVWVGLDPEPLWQAHPQWKRKGITEIVLTAGLRPTLEAHVVRGDGIMLRLAGNGPGAPDPLAELLHTWARECAR